MSASPEFRTVRSANVRAFCGLIFSLVLAIVIFLITDNFAPGAVLASIYAGWRSFFTGVWIYRRDENRPRGRICAAFLVATAFWQGAAAAFLALLILVLVAHVSGRNPGMDALSLIMMQLLAGIVASVLIGILTSVDAAVRAIRVWVHPRLYVMLDQDMRVCGRSFEAVRFNHAVFILATSVGALLMIPLFFFLVQTQLPGLVVAVAFPCVCFGAVAVYAWLSRRIIALHAVECWGAAPDFGDTMLSEDASILPEFDQTEPDQTAWRDDPERRADAWSRNPLTAVTYSCGTVARPGDVVDFDGSQARVVRVVTSLEDAEQSGVDERGLLLRMEDASLIFEPECTACWPENVFIRRGEACDD